MNVLEIKDGRYLEKIYELQKELIDHYVEIEGLPMYPIEVDSKQNQALLKDFGRRFVEELAEGYQELEDLMIIVKCNQYYFQGATYKQADEIADKVIRLNEELADSMHFLIELLIYANIQPSDIDRYISKKLQIEFSPLDIEGVDIITYAMAYCSKLTDKVEAISFESKHDHKIDLHRFILQTTSLPSDLMLAGTTLAPDCLETSCAWLWTITYGMNLSLNCLKNKPWKQTTEQTNVELFQEGLVRTFITYMGYLSYLGLGSKEVFFNYYQKNRDNYERIMTGY
jgi:hypothetical protein